VNLYVGAAGWIAAYCRALKNTLTFPQGEPVTVAMVGGMWEAGELLQKPFRDVLPRFIPNAVIVPPDASPLHGALRLAAHTDKTLP
jgi:ABC-type enterobactin transport system permease subunit